MAGIYGFVAEFNPFHLGHKLFIDKIKTKYHPDVLIAVMSGNYVQRGDFAVMNKWKRAQIAVEYGVDLVIELPFAYAVEPAELFANGAIRLLNSIGIDHLVFGTEDDVDFIDLVTKINDSKIDFTQDYTQNYASNLNNQYANEGIDLVGKPNKLLGLSYAKSIVDNHYDILVDTILRKENDYSSSEIRKRLSKQNDLSVDKLVPKETSDQLNGDQLVSWDTFYKFLEYNILTSSTNELQLIYQMVEGLENKFKKDILTSKTFEEFLFNIKSKRYTRSRLKRLSIYTLLNVKDEEINEVYQHPYLRILAFNKVGQTYLNNVKKNLDFPLITKVGKAENDLMSLELKVDSLIEMTSGVQQNYGVIPFMKGANQC
ncbi:nucleotidyltransferase family protein [Companilactobacillus mishanensis]|uniref:tRNA(Met) cytidine acetate ligase n=1 Tax=Companilactobacillus mishanensis TaxID=2486008 RepID=A0ABW9P5L2_9LACO|nr:nucleotidyltransferase family protein [Companilactobacillus mishanensis]MQS44474.1 hypothetical protein [Companilactobacillus mishanensis]